MYTERDSSKRRPLAVTIIAILAIIVGILSIMSGLLPLTAAAFIPEASGLLLGAGAVLIAIGIVYLVVSYGLLKGKGWAWSITLIVSYIQIVVSIIAIIGGNFFAVGHLIISLVIVYFLYRPSARDYFGKRPNAYI